MPGPSALVAGSGPVGLTMALELVRHGVACRIIDCAPAPTDKSKALVLWGRTLELLQGWPELVSNLQAAGQFIDAASIYGNLKRLVHLRFEREDTAFPRPLMIPQCETERLLAAQLERVGVQVERGVELVDFNVNEDQSITAQLARSDQSRETLDCAWLLGCDGAHSTVRKRLGIEFVGQFEPNDWMLADVRLEGPVAQDELSIYWHTAGILAFFPIRGDRFRVVADLGHAPGEEKPADPTLDDVQATLAARGLGHVRAHDQVWLAGFRIHERKVDQYSRGHVFLAGDAAHIHSPAGGQGMNTGMQDSCNLAWKLALVEQRRAQSTLLETYSAERSAVGDMVLRNATRLTQVATLRNPILQFVRNHVALLAGKLSAVQARAVADLTELAVNYRGSSLNGDDPGGAWSGAIEPGDRLPDARVLELSTGDESWLARLLADGRHHLLLLPEASELATLSNVLSEAGQLTGEFPGLLSVRLILPPGACGDATNPMIASEGTLIDLDGRLRERTGVRATAIALVRPDGYLGFRGHARSWQMLRHHLASYLIPS